MSQRHTPRCRAPGRDRGRPLRTERQQLGKVVPVHIAAAAAAATTLRIVIVVVVVFLVLVVAVVVFVVVVVVVVVTAAPRLFPHRLAAAAPAPPVVALHLRRAKVTARKVAAHARHKVGGRDALKVRVEPPPPATGGW
mgnify:CR=1 FL=1